MENVIRLDQGTIEGLAKAIAEKMKPKVIFSAEEAAEYLSISYRQLLKEVYAGNIRFRYKGSRSYIFKKDWLDDWMDSWWKMDFIRMVTCVKYKSFKERVRIVRILMDEGWKIVEYSDGFVIGEKFRKKGDKNEIN